MADDKNTEPAGSTEQEGVAGEDVEAQNLLADAVADDGRETKTSDESTEVDRLKAALAKANKDGERQRRRLKEIDDAQKSEAEKLAERATTAEQEAATARLEALRYRIASRHQISDEDAETFLTGADEEAMTRQAERLAALRGEAVPKAPKPDPSQGAKGSTAATDIDSRIAEAEEKGDTRAAIALKARKLVANK